MAKICKHLKAKQKKSFLFKRVILCCRAEISRIFGGEAGPARGNDHGVCQEVSHVVSLLPGEADKVGSTFHIFCVCSGVGQAGVRSL